MQNNNLLKTVNLQVGYGKKKKIVLIDNFNYSFAKNKIYFIMGKTGCGKTTLVSHFNGLRRSKQGDIFIKDYSILASKHRIRDFKDIRKIVQLVFQFPEKQLFKSTVIDDVCYGPICLGIDKAKAKALAKDHLNKLGIDDHLFKESPFTLSNGQKRKVAIAGILAITPDIFIFDESMAGLDAKSEHEMLDIIRDLKKQGKTIIVVSHNSNHALELADEVLILHNKQVHSFNNVYELFTKYNNLNQFGLEQPNIIKTINMLGYSSLHKMQARNIEQLAKAINSYKKGGK